MSSRGVRYLADVNPSAEFDFQDHESVVSRPATTRSSVARASESCNPRGYNTPVQEHGDEEQGFTVVDNVSFDFNANRLGEIFKKTMAAIDEHKDTITAEYKNLKRELDIERGNMRSEIKLAKKENRSKKRIQHLEKSEYSTKKGHMNKLHEMLMKHHFSLANVEDGCLEALQDESINYMRIINKTELTLWKRTCQDLHETLDMPVKGFTLKRKWNRIGNIITEARAVVSEGIEQLVKLYTNSGIKPELSEDNAKLNTHVGDGSTWKPIQYLNEAMHKIDEQSLEKKQNVVRLWSSFCEGLKASLCRYTQLVKHDHRHRLESMANHCFQQLREMQQQAARRHGKLMQKVAKEQELLDKERTDMKTKHGERKPRSNHGRHNHHDPQVDTRPPMRMPPGYGGGVSGGMMGGAGMGGYGGGMGNYNMSNAVDVQMCDTVTTELSIEEQTASTNINQISQALYDDISRRSPVITLVYKQSTLYPSFSGSVRQLTPTAVTTLERRISPPQYIQAYDVVDEAGEDTGIITVPSAPAISLSEARVQAIPTIAKSFLIENFITSQLAARSEDELHSISKVSGALHNVDVADNHNVNAKGLLSTASSGNKPENRNVNAESSSSSGSFSSDDATASTTTKTKEKPKAGSTSTKAGAKKASAKGANAGKKKSGGGSMVSRLFGFSSKKKESSSSISSTGSGPGSGSNSGSSSGDGTTDTSGSASRSRPSGDPKKKTAPPKASDATPTVTPFVGEKPENYIEFEPNEHEDKWTLKKICKCCNIDTIVKKCCPCFQNQYEDFKEKRKEKKEQKAMQKDVLLRLRDEANRRRAAY